MAQPAIKRQREEEKVEEGPRGPTDVKPQTKYVYMTGFGNEFETEALPNAVPVKFNTPQICPYGLYAEQLSGTAFTKGKAENQRSWTYRIRPSAVHEPWEKANQDDFQMTAPCDIVDPAQKRWDPLPLPKKKVDWVHGMIAYGGAGDPTMKAGFRAYLFAASTSMGDSSFCNADGDMLIVAQHGDLDVVTEFGRMEVRPGEICVVQRGIKFKVDPVEGEIRGYVVEVFDGHFKIPDLGPIGANGLANPRDFLTPVAWFEDKETKWTCFQKFAGEMWKYKQSHSPFDVVGWHGNYAPYKYDLARFCAVNSVTFDHLDPSIFTVLTCQTTDPGTAAVDFVIFPPRYMVQMDTFRPPYYHRNCMSEFMGNICGAYEAKAKGFLPGGATLHSCMSGHGPDANGFEKASKLDTSKVQAPSMTDLAFMFESGYIMRLSKFAASNLQDGDYWRVWQGLKKHFKEQ